MLAACRNTRKTAINLQHITLQQSNIAIDRMEHPLRSTCMMLYRFHWRFHRYKFYWIFQAVPYLDWWQTASSQDLRSESPLWVLHAMPWMRNTKRNMRKDISLALISWTVFNPPKQSKHTSKSKPIVGLNLWLQAKNSNRWAANFGVLEIGPHAYIVPNPYQRFMVISTEESKTANYKFTSRAKATSLSEKLDILRKERNVTCPSKETTKTPLFSCWVQEFGPTSTIKCLKLKTPIFHSAFPFHSTIFFVFRQFWDQGAAWSLSNSTGLEDTRKGVASPESKKLPTAPSKEYPWLCPIAKLMQTWE